MRKGRGQRGEREGMGSDLVVCMLDGWDVWDVWMERSMRRCQCLGVVH